MQKLVKELFAKKIKSPEDLMKAKRLLAKKLNQPVLSNAEILKAYRKELVKGKIKPGLEIEKTLRKRQIRTLSGVAPVAVLTMPYPCPGKCIYCPTEKDVPQSYLSNEPAVMRAIRCDYSPYRQVQFRLRALEANGHRPNKIELIVIGGTWSVLPKKYKHWYIKECFRAANNYPLKQTDSKVKENVKPEKIKTSLLSEQKRNEKTSYKIIGLTLETRPDYVNRNEVLEMRTLGCTRVELGVQAIDDKILRLNKRGHNKEEIVRATQLLKDFGFKVTYHLMPGLPGSTAKKDLKMFKQLFTDQRFQPDQIKLYPTIVTQGSLLYRWWKQGKYKPYSSKVLENLIINCKKEVPPYVRIIRLIRDIPGESIIAGNTMTNLRQIIQDKGARCNCIRCREVKNKKINSRNLKLDIIKYKASEGMEYFLQIIDKNNCTLYGFCRLRLPETEKVALIRELHVYGELVPVGPSKNIQHIGLGKKLMKKAEKISQENDFSKILVISGVGARGYYRKLGYKLKNTYMAKHFN